MQNSFFNQISIFAKAKPDFKENLNAFDNQHCYSRGADFK